MGEQLIYFPSKQSLDGSFNYNKKKLNLLPHNNIIRIKMESINFFAMGKCVKCGVIITLKRKRICKKCVGTLICNIFCLISQYRRTKGR